MRFTSASLLVLIASSARGFTQPSSLISQPRNVVRNNHKPPVTFMAGSGSGKDNAIARKRGFTLKSAASTAIDSQGNNENDHTKEIAETKSKLTKEFFTIAFPAFIQLAAEPLASLVDTAYLGRMGPEVLGGAGVAISAQYAVSKLYNDPLLRTSISLVAAQDGKARSNQAGAGGEDADSEENAKKELSIAVSSALLLALSVGVIQLVIYASLSSVIIKGMG